MQGFSQIVACVYTLLYITPVYKYARTYIYHMHIHMLTRTYVNAYARKYVRAKIRTYVNTHTYLHNYIILSFMYMQVHSYTGRLMHWLQNMIS